MRCTISSNSFGPTPFCLYLFSYFSGPMTVSVTLCALSITSFHTLSSPLHTLPISNCYADFVRLSTPSRPLMITPSNDSSDHTDSSGCMQHTGFETCYNLCDLFVTEKHQAV
ncbi:uncharacterized protein UBRO_20762 [Ustilago bromivora]|uniref:Uncharacterized protein n=1 Tax=Ustilago bromivora TaxID=307758 RepID=A0A1K0G6W6_9BASI|nr:uncharacterized protein UBRO_20762 [Ustilago bromivora]